jgi:hypothetical protein
MKACARVCACGRSSLDSHPATELATTTTFVQLTDQPALLFVLLTDQLLSTSSKRNRPFSLYYSSAASYRGTKRSRNLRPQHNVKRPENFRTSTPGVSAKDKSARAISYGRKDAPTTLARLSVLLITPSRYDEVPLVEVL